MILDYSYMMILELRYFYRQKYGALAQCRVSCQDIYEIAHHLCVRLDPAIRKVYDYTQAFRGASSDEGLLRVAASGDRVQFGASNAVRTFTTECALYTVGSVHPLASAGSRTTVLFLSIYHTVVRCSSLFPQTTNVLCIPCG